MIKRYRKRPIEAVQWTGDNFEEIRSMINADSTIMKESIGEDKLITIETEKYLFFIELNCYVVSGFKNSLTVFDAEKFEKLFLKIYEEIV